MTKFPNTLYINAIINKQAPKSFIEDKFVSLNLIKSEFFTVRIRLMKKMKPIKPNWDNIIT